MNDSNSKGTERRKSFRLDMEKELVDILWTDGDEQEHHKKIACVDFARGGLKLDCDQGIAVNTPVVVVFQSANASSQKLYGKVLRCIKQKNGWFEIGLAINKDAE